MTQHNYYVVITAKVLMDRNLTDKQKLLVGLIANLSNEKGYCFASNKYLSEILQCSESTIRQHISDLEAKNYLSRIVKLNEKNIVEFRSLMILDPSSEIPAPPPLISGTPPSEKSAHNNKEDNNKEFNNKIIIKVDFAIFWNLYDKKVGDVKKVKKKWEGLPRKTQEKIIEILPKFKLQFSEKQFQPHASTFLNQERWNDEIIISQFAKSKIYYPSSPVGNDDTHLETVRQPTYNPVD